MGNQNKCIGEKTFYLVGGINGVGKSTYIKWFEFENKVDVIIDPDRSAIEEGGLIAGCRKALTDIERCIEQGMSFCQETTLSSRQVINTITKAKAKGYTVNLTYLGLDTAEECIARVVKRVSEGGHHIPDDVIRRRFANRFECLARVLPLCDSGFIMESFEDYSYNIASIIFDGILYDFNLNERKWVAEFLAYYQAHGGNCRNDNTKILSILYDPEYE